MYLKKIKKRDNYINSKIKYYIYNKIDYFINFIYQILLLNYKSKVMIYWIVIILNVLDMILERFIFQYDTISNFASIFDVFIYINLWYLFNDENSIFINIIF